jgi:ATP-dependent Clp protease ATP-binding subunit ClpC
VYERFTPPARQVVVLGDEEARALNHGYIGVEHLLLGLLREREGIAARALARLGVSVDRVRAEVAKIESPGDPDTPQLPFSPRAKRVLERAPAEADALGHAIVGTEHVLLSLAAEEGGIARALLEKAGADAETVRGAVLGVLSGSG